MTRWMIPGLLAALVLAAPAAARTGDRGAILDGATFVHEQDGPVQTEAWWHAFGDEALAAAVDAGLADNGDVQGAWERVSQARAMSHQSLALALPSASFDVNVSTAPTDSLGFQFGGMPSVPGEERPDVYHTGSAMLGVAVPLHLWGSALPTYRASRFDAQATEGDSEAQAMALASHLAGAYFDVLAAQEQVALIEGQIQANESLLELTELRYQQSEATGLDVLQQRQQLHASRAMLPQARMLANTRDRQLEALLGRSPGAGSGARASGLPPLPPTPATGRPADLPEHRPDLRASGLRLDAAATRRNATLHAMMPTLQLTAGVGTQAMYMDEYDSIETWSVGAALSIPLFQGTRNWASFAEARAGLRSAQRTHDQLLLQAVADVDIALMRETQQTETLQAYGEQLDAAGLAYTEARALYAGGLSSYLTVLTALNTRHQAQLNVLSAHRDLIDARIDLYEALGGPWTDSLSAGRGVDR
jgi:NodT family efflux transporter outer membrane factor (OMF) lipoprotein